MGQSERVEQAVGIYNLDRERKKKAPRTRELEALVLRQFCQSLKYNCWMSQVTEEDVHNYFYGERGVSSRCAGQSFNQYLGRFRAFEKFAIRKGWWTSMLSEDIDDLPVEEAAEKLRLNVDESWRLLDFAKFPRDRAAIALGFELGPRASEVGRVLIKDLHLDHAEPDIVLRRTKNEHNHMRFVRLPVTPNLEIELREWLKVYAAGMGMTVPQLLEQKDWYLFPSQTRIPAYVGASEGTIGYRPTVPTYRPGRMVRRALEAAGYEDTRIGFHTTRRSAGRMFFDHVQSLGPEGGDPMRQTQMLLGHARIEQTGPYIGVTPDEAKRNETLRRGSFRRQPLSGGGDVIPIDRMKGA